MTSKLIELFEAKIKALPWVERYGGMTRPLTVDQTDGKTLLGKRTYPVACKLDEGACLNGRYFDMTPDSSKKSLVYWESKGDVSATRFTANDYEFGGTQRFTAPVRLVAWINLQKLGITGCWASSAPIKELLAILDDNYVMPTDVITMQFNLGTIILNQKKIFEGYNYEDKQPLMMYPYYAFAITGDLVWAESYACLDEEWTYEPIECLDLSI